MLGFVLPSLSWKDIWVYNYWPGTSGMVVSNGWSVGV